MIRSWGVVTLTGSAQPIFGDVTTAAIAAKPASGIIPVTVGSTTRYRIGDRIIIHPGNSDADTLLVEQIPSSTVLSCVAEGDAPTHTHVTSTIITLAISCAEILLTGVTGNAGTTWLGSDSTVTNVGGGSGFTFFNGGGFYNLGFPQWNAITSTEGWIAGTASDKVGVAAIVV